MADFSQKMSKKEKRGKLIKVCCVSMQIQFSVVLFDFDDGFRRFRNDMQSLVIHPVEQSIKLATLCAFVRALVGEKELIYGYIVTGNKLVKDLQARQLSFVLYVCKIAGR